LSWLPIGVSGIIRSDRPMVAITESIALLGEENLPARDTGAGYHGLQPCFARTLMEKLPIPLSGRRPSDHSARTKEIVPFHPRHRFRRLAGNPTDMKIKLVRCPVNRSSVSVLQPIPAELFAHKEEKVAVPWLKMEAAPKRLEKMAHSLLL